jgi:hypothetical protein
MQTKSKLQEWALERCKAWNWNFNVAEIAKELIDADIAVDSLRFRALEKEFVEFFPANGEQQIETIRDIMETFA